jgi:lysophospholipase L1-like esterase
MIDCMIMGDSIAVGTHMMRPKCVSYSQIGITSQGWNRRFGGKNITAETVIISLGTNDGPKADTYGMLMNIRTKIKGDAKVFWIEPNRESRFETVQNVRRVANQFGDTVLVNTKWSKDKIHPTSTGYKELADSTK